MRPIDADRLKETIKKLDVESPDIKTARIISQTIQEIFSQIIDDEPTIEAEPVTWYTADENQPDSVGDDVLIVDHDNKYHVAYYCSKGNWIDTNTGNPIEVVKWRYLDGDSDDKP